MKNMEYIEENNVQEWWETFEGVLGKMEELYKENLELKEELSILKTTKQITTMAEQLINITLTVSEVNFILTALGEIPSKTGAWNLIVAIKEQADPQFIPDELVKEEEELTDPEEILP
jgi:hypothetical protein